MSNDNTNPESNLDNPSAEDSEESADIISIPCRVKNRDGSKGCGGFQARRVEIHHGPTFYVCESCGGRWLPVQVGGTFSY